jgi:phospholipid/cholesterol/gamma-HCH transport system ATP-binding protein
LGGRAVLDALSLQVRRGEALVVMGPSGEGKTVLLKHMIGLYQPTAGRLRVFGEDFWRQSSAAQTRLRRRFGFGFQEAALFDSMSVGQNVAFPLRRHPDFPDQKIAERVAQCLELVRLPGIEDLRTFQLSTGMRRRVGFARAIALEPEILLFDEPTAGLDPVMVTVISRLIRELHQRLHAATVMVTHDLAAARQVADRVALLFRGKIAADAPTDAFFELQDPVVRQLLDGRAEGPITEEDWGPL